MTSFDGRAVYVFGAAGALGAGLATAFRDEGARVIGVDRSADQSTPDGVELRVADVFDDASVERCFAAGPTPWAAVNTVGGFAPRTPLTEIEPDLLELQVRLNMTSAALVTKHALRAMRAAGEGRIVHTASRAAMDPGRNGFAYSVSKLGVLHLVKMAAEEVRGTAITVNAVVPSVMDTPANRRAMPNADHTTWPKVSEIAAVYVFLASPAAQLVSGAAIPVYGLT